MKILTSYSEANECLYVDWFFPTCPVQKYILSRKLMAAGTGEFGSPEWEVGVTGKVQFAVDYIASQPEGTVFVMADPDIQFFEGFSLEVLQKGLQDSGCVVLFQREHAPGISKEVNTGFYVARTSPDLGNFFQEVLEIMSRAGVKNDQTAVNAMLPEAGIKWGYLPGSYYCRTQGFPPPRDIVLHHANGTKQNSLRKKIAQLRRVRRYVRGGMLGRGLAMLGEIRSVVQAKGLLGKRSGSQ